MSDVWEHSDRVLCVHPGWWRLRGWGAVSAGWVALFTGPQELQFILTEESVEVVGDLAWVSVDENLLSSSSDATGATVAALNVFARDPEDHRWRMIIHHGAPVGGGEPPG